MMTVSVNMRLRPTRIGFLVRPTDMVSVRKIMRVCACLWGGLHNPIIPVFRKSPKVWRPERHEPVKGLAIAKGYINFFEPDVFVESENGLLKDAGLGALAEGYSRRKHVVSLGEFLTRRDNRDWSEPFFGLSIVDVFHHLYDTEQRFQLRDKRPSVLVSPVRQSGLAEAIFGAFPRQGDAAYIERQYKRVFAPKELEATTGAWLQVFKQGALTPLLVSQHRIDTKRYWHHDLLVFIFDPREPTDLIDLWNLRLEPHPVLPVPIEWFEGLVDHVCEFIKREHRPVRGNAQGVMHHATVEFSRSITKDQAESCCAALRKDLPSKAAHFKHGRNRIWVQHTDDRVYRDQRLEVTTEEQSINLPVKEGGELTASFEALYPEFASRFGGHESRWMNAVKVSVFGPEKIATVLPFNIFDRRWPRIEALGDWITVGSEGWVFAQRYRNRSVHLTLLTKEEAIIGSLKRLGIEANMSDPGHIARQMLDHLGGVWGVQLLAELETLKLLNKMAGGVRRKSNNAETVEETFERRSAPVKDWVDRLMQRKERHSVPTPRLSDFTRRNVIRLGLETKCPHCQATNWHSLTIVDYDVTCERCLKRYEFPQAQLRENNRNWSYRVVGPFSVPDFGRGAYSALLSLRALKELIRIHGDMTFSTAMDLKFDGIETEADFVAWQRDDVEGVNTAPQLIIGEAKSLGDRDLIKPKDLMKLKAIGRKLPGAIIVISVLRDKFTNTEKKLLVPFVRWGRRPDDRFEPTNPVILLTGHELFADFLISLTWKKLGKPHDAFTDFEHTRNLRNFADATQQIYLGLPSVHKKLIDKWEQRRKRTTTKPGLSGANPSA